MRIVTGAFMALALAATPALAQDQPRATQQQTSSLRVASGDELIGRSVTATDGTAVGTLARLLIDTRSGAVRYALVAEQGQQGWLPVPWSVVDVPQTSSAIRVQASPEQLRKAAHVSQDRIAELTSADAWRVIERQYVPADQKRSASAKQMQDTGAPWLLVDRGSTLFVTAPAMAQARQLAGSMVHTAGGKPIGEIDHVMIDLAHGRVAYLLVETGGFLGAGGKWMPVPLEALAWWGDGQGVRLSLDDTKLNLAPVLSKEPETPDRVSVAHLATVYERFGVTPYWQRMAPRREG